MKNYKAQLSLLISAGALMIAIIIPGFRSMESYQNGTAIEPNLVETKFLKAILPAGIVPESESQIAMEARIEGISGQHKKDSCQVHLINVRPEILSCSYDFLYLQDEKPKSLEGVVYLMPGEEISLGHLGISPAKLGKIPFALLIQNVELFLYPPQPTEPEMALLR